MTDIPTQQSPETVTLKRLDDQIDWYDRKSSLNQRRFKLMKGLTIASAAAIPVLTTTSIPNGRYIAAGLGVLIAIMEGLATDESIQFELGLLSRHIRGAET
jgi:Protein of unknown function (DUF4231)